MSAPFLVELLCEELPPKALARLGNDAPLRHNRPAHDNGPARDNRPVRDDHDGLRSLPDNLLDRGAELRRRAGDNA